MPDSPQSQKRHHSIEEAQALIRPLIGLVVSLPWKGCGSAIFLELGQLAPLQSPHQRHNNGEACISVEWDWRVESETRILYGSSNRGPQIEEGIRSLQGSTVQGLDIVGRIPELAVQFSNGLCLRSMVMVAGHPEWSIRLHDGTWLYSRNGGVRSGGGGSVTTEQEKAVFASAEKTAKRWGIPTVEPKPGSCAVCNSFVRLDGNGHLLEYGVCTATSSPFDGRAVNRNSGCPSFTSKTEI